MSVFLDASALVKRYVPEAGASLVDREVTAADAVYASRFSLVEVTSAIERRRREGGLSPAAREQALRSLGADAGRLRLVELGEAVVESARALLGRHPLRAADALQLASCLPLRERTGLSPRFLCFDERLNGAARSEGLQIPDPSTR